MNNEEIRYIYVLKDPRDNSVRYVGMTKDPKKRFYNHCRDRKRKNNKKSTWTNSLFNAGLKPAMEIVKEARASHIHIWEEYFIAHYKKIGCDLLNYDDKGIGILGEISKEEFARVRKLAVEATKKSLSEKIVQYDLSGNFIKEFNSFRDAERETGINHGNISKCCSGKFKHTSGFIFRKKEASQVLTPVSVPNAAKKPIVEVDNSGNIIKEYISIGEASRDTGIDNGNISRVCNGIRKSIKGRFFKFK